MIYVWGTFALFTLGHSFTFYAERYSLITYLLTSILWPLYWGDELALYQLSKKS